MGIALTETGKLAEPDTAFYAAAEPRHGAGSW